MHHNYYCGLELNTAVCKRVDTSVNTHLKIIFSRRSRSDLGLLVVSGTEHLLTGNPFIFHLTEAEDPETMPPRHLGLRSPPHPRPSLVCSGVEYPGVPSFKGSGSEPPIWQRSIKRLL